MNIKDSALSLDARVYLHDIEKADLLVGIPSFNNVLTASYVLSQVIKGLDTYFPNFRSVIFVSDGNSKDDTLTSVKMVDLPSEVKLIPAIYKSFLDQELQNKFEQVKQLENSNPDSPSEIWAKTVYSFIAEFHKKPSYGQEKLIDALRMLWIGRVAVFLKETWEKSREDTESIISNEALVFKKLKHYLIEKY
jgi:hypothetical protein